MGIPFVNNPFAAPQSEYSPGPVPIPPVPPDFTPVNVPISCYWIPWVVGSLKAQLQEATWRNPSPADLEITLGRVADLLAIFETAMQSGACSALGVPFSCDYDFAATSGSYTNIPEPSLTPATLGNYTPVAGWLGSDAQFNGGGNFITACYIHRLLPAAEQMTSVTMTYNLHKTVYVAGVSNNTGIVLLNAGTVVATQLIDSQADTDGTGKQIIWTGSVMADEIRLIVTGRNDTVDSVPANIAITDSVVTGVGANTCH